MLGHKLKGEEVNKWTLNQFHKQSLKCWFEIKSQPPKNRNDILNEYIFENRHITINNMPFSPKDFGLNSSVMRLKIFDILHINNNLYSSVIIFCMPFQF